MRWVLGALFLANVGWAKDICCVGDGNVVGQNNTGYVPGGFRYPLEQLLLPSYPSTRFVGNSAWNPADGQIFTGHDGFSGVAIDSAPNADGIRPMLPSFFNWIQPEIVIIWVGLKDFVLNVSPDTVPKRLYSLATDVLNLDPRAKVIVCTIPQTLSPTYSSQISEANIAIKKFGARPFRKDKFQVYVCDLNSLLIPTDYIDDYHPNANGFQKIANHLRIFMVDNQLL